MKIKNLPNYDYLDFEHFNNNFNNKSDTIEAVREILKLEKASKLFFEDECNLHESLFSVGIIENLYNISEMTKSSIVKIPFKEDERNNKIIKFSIVNIKDKIRLYLMFKEETNNAPFVVPLNNNIYIHEKLFKTQ